MSRMLSVSDQLYERLETTARRLGFSGIEELLESLPATSSRCEARLAAVERADALFARLSATYGAMPDSVDLVRADRER